LRKNSYVKGKHLEVGLVLALITQLHIY